jgi:hypothetical protein
LIFSLPFCFLTCIFQFFFCLLTPLRIFWLHLLCFTIFFWSVGTFHYVLIFFSSFDSSYLSKLFSWFSTPFIVF